MTRAPRPVTLCRRAGSILAALCAIWLGLALPLLAQDEPDYTAWDRIATRAEDEVSAGTMSSQALDQLRADIVRWRDRFSGAQSINAPRITTIKDQISALGPAPADGATEDPGISARRKELNAQLAELQAPGLRAVEAHSR